MIDRVGVIDHALAIRYKFNKLLENALIERKNHFLFDISNAISDPALFSQPLKKLNGDGEARYWLEIDNAVKEKFKPRRRTTQKFRPRHNKYNNNKHPRYNSSSQNMEDHSRNRYFRR